MSLNGQLFTGRRLSWSIEVILNGFSSVDTFFFMSGLLVAYLTFFELENKRFNLGLFYAHRYVRLTIPLVLVIAWTAVIEPLLGSGFYWDTGITSTTARWCREGWWTNLLYINNFYAGTDGICLGQTWYLACDMQMFVVSPLVILPLFYWRKRHGGLIVWAVVMAGLTALQIYLTVAHNLPPTHLWP